MSERAAKKCCGKKRHRSERCADVWAKKTQIGTGVPMTSYACEYCKGWHVGSRKLVLRPERELPRTVRFVDPAL